MKQREGQWRRGIRLGKAEETNRFRDVFKPHCEPSAVCSLKDHNRKNTTKKTLNDAVTDCIRLV